MSLITKMLLESYSTINGGIFPHLQRSRCINRGTLKEKQSFLVFVGLGWRGKEKEGKEVPSSTKAPLYITDGWGAKKNREDKEAEEGNGGGPLQALTCRYWSLTLLGQPTLQRDRSLNSLEHDREISPQRRTNLLKTLRPFYHVENQPATHLKHLQFFQCSL